MRKRRLILCCIGLVTIACFFILPVNNKWGSTVFSYWKDFTRQKNNLDPEARMVERFGTHYTVSKAIADSLRKKTTGEVLLLMPPNSYFRKMKMNYDVPIPPVFYYFTGIKTVWTNNPNATKANWYVRIENNKIIVDSITARKAISYE
ncbi:MAG TPA: hypothetical protein VD996_04605 [Chitinophagaceae bacterium]|nr:hypothetical protein [Chitinophagaceae bacterium]